MTINEKTPIQKETRLADHKRQKMTLVNLKENFHPILVKRLSTYILWAFACILFMEAPQVKAQSWIGPNGGDWSDSANWLGARVPGDRNDPFFVPGSIVQIKGPLQGSTGLGEITLGGNEFSTGVILIDSLNGIRLNNGRIVLGEETPGFVPNSLLFVRDGRLVAGPELTFELERNAGRSIPVFVEEGRTFEVNGQFSGVGGFAAAGPGTIIISNVNTHEGPTAVNSGELLVLNGGKISNDVFVSGGSLVNRGTIGGMLSVAGGDSTNTGTVDGAITVTGGTLNIVGGSYGGGLINQFGGELNVQGALSGANLHIVNFGEMTVTSPLIHSGNLTSSGIVTLGADYTGIDRLTLTGRISTKVPGMRPTLGTAGTTSIYATGDALLDLRGAGEDGRQLSVAGDLTGSIRVELAPGLVDRSVAPSIPVLDWTGTLSSTANSVILDFGAHARIPQLGAPVPILRVTSPEVSGVSVIGLPETATVAKSFLSFDATSKTFNLVTVANPALSSVAGTITTIDSIIGTGINRLNYTSLSNIDTKCIRGPWFQGLGGHLHSTFETSQIVPNLSILSEVSVTYHGLRSGYDLGCSSMHNGWDLSGGVTFGLTQGSSRQNEFQLNNNPVTNTFSRGVLTSVTRSDFHQTYGGLYLEVADRGWFGNLQIVHERSRYSFTNSALDSRNVLPLSGQRYKAHGNTVSGSISRRFVFPNGLLLTPTVGFGVVRRSGGSLDLINSNGTVAGRLDIQSHTNRFVFAGANLTREYITDDGMAGINHFVNLALQRDLGTRRKASLTQFAPDNVSSGTTVDLSTDHQKIFGVLSFGINHFRKLQTKIGGGQMNLSVQGDLRISPNVRNFGITVQGGIRF